MLLDSEKKLFKNTIYLFLKKFCDILKLKQKKSLQSVRIFEFFFFTKTFFFRTEIFQAFFFFNSCLEKMRVMAHEVDIANGCPRNSINFL